MLDEKTILSLKDKGYYNSGEFAKMFDINKSMLLYYDCIDLFKPEIVRENGYRYYSWKQFDDIMLILILRDMGMSLSSIKKYKENRSPQSFAKLLKNLSRSINAEWERLYRIQSYISGRKSITEEALSASLKTISIKALPEEYFFTTPFDGDPFIIDDAYIIEANHNKSLNQLNITSPYSVGEITSVSREKGQKKIIHHSFFQTKLENISLCPSPWVRKEGKYLTIYHNEGYWYTPKYHQQLLTYAKNNNLITGSHFYDEYLLDELSTNIPDSYLIRITLFVDS